MRGFTGTKVMPFSTPLGSWDTLTYLEIFEYYDTPVLFSALDGVGKIFIATQISDDKRANKVTWLYSELTQNSYHLLRSGDLDLRRAFLDEISPYFIIVDHYFNEEYSKFQSFSKDSVDIEWLPEDGEYLDEEERIYLGAIPSFNTPPLRLVYEPIKIDEKIIENVPVYYDLRAAKYFSIYDSIKVIRLSDLKLQSNTRNFTNNIAHPMITIGFKGREYSERFPAVNLWEEAAGIVSKSYRKAYYAARKKEGHDKPISYPSALGLAASVTFELYPKEEATLFGHDAKKHSEAFTLDTLANVLENVKNNNSDSFESNPEFYDMMLQAIEDLAPSESSNYEYVEVSVLPTPRTKLRRFTITEETKDAVRSNRLKLASINSGSRIITLIGVIYEMRLDYEKMQARMRVQVISVSASDLGKMNKVDIVSTIENVEAITKYLSEKPVKITASYNVTRGRKSKRNRQMRLLDIQEHAESHGKNIKIT